MSVPLWTAVQAAAASAVQDAAVEAAAAQEVEEATATRAAQAALALKAERALAARAAHHAKNGKKRLVNWKASAEAAGGATAAEAAASAASARSKEAEVLAAVAAQETMEEMGRAWMAGGEAAAREAGRWRAQDLEETLVQAREAARAVTDEAAAATSAMPVIYE